MHGTISHEREVNVSASKAWKLYGTIQLAELANKSFTNLFTKVDVIEGDGGVGTILEIFFTPETPGMRHYKEKYTVVDNENRVKVAEVVEGGYLDIGFTLYRFRIEIIEKEENKCITKATIEYELKEEAIANIKFVSVDFFVTLVDLAADHLIESTTTTKD